MLTEEKTISSEYIYKGKILNLRKDQVTVRDGKISDREIIEHNGAVAILPIIPIVDEGKTSEIILVKQYRKAFDDFLIEIPAGKLEKNEDPKEAAIRELKEETGYEVKNINHIFNTGLAVGYSNEVLHFYIANLGKQGATNFDESEDIEIIKMKFSDAIDLIENQKIVDAKTIMALYYYKNTELK